MIKFTPDNLVKYVVKNLYIFPINKTITEQLKYNLESSCNITKKTDGITNGV